MAVRRWVCVLLLFHVGLAGAAAPAANDYVWPNLSDFLRQIIHRLGPPVKVYKLELDGDGKVDLWLQDQARRDLIDSYEYDRGKVSGPFPVKFEHYPTIATLDRHVVELTTIDFQRLPEMLVRARAALNLPDARVSHIDFERGDSGGKHAYRDFPIWTFHMDSPRHDGSVQFDLAGQVLHVDRD